jgi:Lrp/AsnC family transcriptional regulator for asnA, asnC and gidA
MAQKYEIDSTDHKIIQELQRDARKPFLEIARKLKVSGGTIHQRYLKLQEMGIIQGSSIHVNYAALGYGVTVFLGIHLKSANDLEMVVHHLKQLREITEVYYTTGGYALLVKVLVKDIDHFHIFLVKGLQKIEGVESTESFISLDTVLERELELMD